MEYSILEYVRDIGAGKILLPALQRGLVWESERIEFLFDSLVRGFPIGSFLFWEVNKDTANEYVFYKFIDDYSEKDGGTRNEIAVNKEKPTQEEKIISVIDGQQRLSALYIGLHGTYKTHIKYRGKKEDKNYVAKELYVNLFADFNDKETSIFKFLSEEDLKNEKVTSECKWYKVKNLITKGLTTNNVQTNVRILIDLENELKINTNKGAVTILSTLITILSDKKVLKCYYYDNDEIENVLEAFIRTNHQGKPLSKADLIFSTIVADNPDFRETIENYLEVLNNIGKGFDFDKDFVLKACQMIVNSTPKNDIKSIKGKTAKIYDTWEDIAEKISYVVRILDDLGFYKHTVTANNAVLPIVYYRNRIQRDFNQDEIQIINKYIICSFVKGVFGGSSDTVLQNMMNEIDGLIEKGENINVSWLQNVELEKDGNKTFVFNDGEIENILNTYVKGSSGAEQILLLLYDNLRFKDRYFHEDHIHAASLFSSKKMKQLGISIDEDKLKDWQSKRNLLPNLQLLEKYENIKKQDELYEDWYKKHNDLKDKYIDYDKWSLKLEDFDDFYKNRRKKLFNKLKELLVI